MILNKKNITAVLLLVFSMSLNLASTYALVGVEEVKKMQPSSLTKKSKTKKTNNQSNKNTNQNKDNTSLSSLKPANMPDFPQESEEAEYRTLFNDGFSNIVENNFQSGEEWDVFINQTAGKQINQKYIAGNDEEYTQMDAIEAEKKTFIDHSLVDKNNITTHRTRIMAYLTLDQMLFDDIFGEQPHGYYITAITKRG